MSQDVRPMKILLLDDSALMLGLLGALLERAGHAITSASTLVEAVDAYSRQPFDALLLDFILESNQTGFDVLSVLAALPDRRLPPAAILTQGGLAAPDQAKAIKLGVAVFQKPKRGQEPELVAQLDAWLKSEVR